MSTNRNDIEPKALMLSTIADIVDDKLDVSFEIGARIDKDTGSTDVVLICEDGTYTTSLEAEDTSIDVAERLLAQRRSANSKEEGMKQLQEFLDNSSEEVKAKFYENAERRLGAVTLSEMCKIFFPQKTKFEAMEIITDVLKAISKACE